jgi:hypothetical protein
MVKMLFLMERYNFGGIRGKIMWWPEQNENWKDVQDLTPS